MAKKLFSLTLVLCMALTMAISLPAMAEGVNLATNGDFEAGLAEGAVKPAGWRSTSASDFDFHASLPQDNTQKGACLVKATAENPARPNTEDPTDANGVGDYFIQVNNGSEQPQRLATDARLTPGKSYKVSFWSKDIFTTLVKEHGASETNTSLWVNFDYATQGRIVFRANYWMDGYYENSGNDPWPGDWVKHEFYLSVPGTPTAEKPTTFTTFIFQKQRNGEVYYIDDFSIVELDNGIYSATLKNADTLKPGSTATIDFGYGKAYKGYSGTEEWSNTTTFDSDKFEVITAIYKVEGERKTLCKVEITPLDGGCKQYYNSGGIAEFVAWSGGKEAKQEPFAFGHMIAQQDIEIKVPGTAGDTDTYVCRVFTWDSVSGLTSRAEAITLGGVAE